MYKRIAITNIFENPGASVHHSLESEVSEQYSYSTPFSPLFPGESDSIWVPDSYEASSNFRMSGAPCAGNPPPSSKLGSPSHPTNEEYDWETEKHAAEEEFNELIRGIESMDEFFNMFDPFTKETSADSIDFHPVISLLPPPPENVNDIIENADSVFFGDPHGCLGELFENLEMANLWHCSGNEYSLDCEDVQHPQWIGGTKKLIVMGDIIDRGPHSKETLQFLIKLQESARAQGGDVIILLGNHELSLILKNFSLSSDWLTDEKEKRQFINTLLYYIINGNIQAAADNLAPWTTHAGIDPRLLDHPKYKDKSAEELAALFNEALLNLALTLKVKYSSEYKIIKFSAKFKKQPDDKLTLKCLENAEQDYQRHSLAVEQLLLSDPIFWVGPERGGSDPFGGIFWCDISALLNIDPNQLFITAENGDIQSEIISERAWNLWAGKPQFIAHSPTIMPFSSDNCAYSNGHITDMDTGTVYGGLQAFQVMTNKGRLYSIYHDQDNWEVKPLINMNSPNTAC
ncbi:metallophosphoesterase [Thermoproteota archaeon]